MGWGCQWYQVQVEAGKSLSVFLDKTADWYSYLSIKYGSLPDGSPDVSTYGYGDLEIEIPNTQAGYYYIKVEKDSSGIGTYSIIANLLSNAVLSVSPDKGGNVEIVTVTINGSGFQEGAVVKLVRMGQPDIIGTETSVVDSTQITTKFDLTGKEPGVWDVVVINPDKEVLTLPEAFTIFDPKGLEIPFGSWQKFTVKDETLLTVNVPAGVNALLILLKKTTHIGYSSTWAGSLRLLKQGKQIAFVQGENDFDIHIQNPESGWYTLEIVSNPSGEGLIKACADLDTLPLSEWKIGKVLRPYGCDWWQLDVPANQESLFFKTEGFGLWSTLDIYYGYLGNKDKHWKTSYGDHIEYKITNPPAGRYYLRYMDSAVLWSGNNYSSDQTREYMIIADTKPIEQPPPSKPIITKLSTYKGGTAGPVTVIISGEGLNGSATVSLIRDGYPDVIAIYVSGTITQRELIATFDLSQAEPGKWTLKVTNPDGQSATAPEPFVVEKGGEPKLWVEIVGRNNIRIGRSQRYVIKYGNNGAVDTEAEIILWLSKTMHAEVIDSTGEGLAKIIPDVVGLDGEANCMGFQIILWNVPPQSEGELYLVLFLPKDVGNFTINARITDDFGVNLSSRITHHLGESVISTTNPQVALSTEEEEEIEIEGQEWEGYEVRIESLYPVVKVVREKIEHAVIVLPVFDENGNLTREKRAYTEKTSENGQGWLVKMPPEELEKEYKKKNWVKQSGKLKLKKGDVWNLFKRFEKCVYENITHIHQEQPFYAPKENAFDCIGRIYHESRVANVRGGEGLFHLDPYKYEGAMWKDAFKIEISPWDRTIFGQIISPKKIGNADISSEIIPVTSTTPEDKYGPTGYDFPDTAPAERKRFVSADKEFSYRIDFWNKETATAPAQEVFVKDTLDANLDDSTFAFTEFGFLRWTIPLEDGQYFNVNVDMRPDMNLIVNVEGRYDPSSREINWTFRSLDPETMELPEDPMIGFLPPITESGYEIGWVNFKVRPKVNLPTGTQIKNQAFVKFDVGPWKPAPKNPDSDPPGYGPWTNTIDRGAPTSSVNPLATHQWSSSFKVSWFGKDDEGGSGIKDYTVYVSDNGGTYTPWLTNTTETSATFTGSPGHTYSFYSTARDNVGNVENPPATFDAQTNVLGFRYQVSANSDNDIRLPDGTRIFIPKGALSGDTFLVISFPDPNTVPPTPGRLQTTGVYRELSLENGQTEFLNGKVATIWIPYEDRNPNDGVVDGTEIKEDTLKVFFWNGRAWVRDFDTVVDAINNLCKINTTHLTTFGIFSMIAQNLENVVVYPNPFKPSKGHIKIRFEGLTENVTIRIYNIAGELVKSEENIITGFFDWDVKNDSGEKVASGVYIYVITDDEGRIKKGKIAIIR